MLNICSVFCAACVSVFFDIVCLIFSQAPIRRSSAYLLGYFFKNSKLYLVDEAPNLISTLIVLLSDSDSATVVVCLAFVYLLSLSIFMLWNYVILSFLKGRMGSLIKGCKFHPKGDTSFVYQTCTWCCIYIERQGAKEKKGTILTMKFYVHFCIPNASHYLSLLFYSNCFI